MREELVAVAEKYGDERRTKIVKGGVKNMSVEDLVPDEDSVLVLTQGGGSTTGSALTAALGAGSAVFYAAVVLGSRRATKAFTPIAVMSLHSVISALMLALIFGKQVLPVVADRGLLIVLFGCLVNGLFAALLFNLSLQRIEAQLVGLFTYLEPLGAALLGVLVLGDPFGLSTAAGLFLVLAAGGWAATQRIEVVPIAEP